MHIFYPKLVEINLTVDDARCEVVAVFSSLIVLDDVQHLLEFHELAMGCFDICVADEENIAAIEIVEQLLNLRLIIISKSRFYRFAYFNS